MRLFIGIPLDPAVVAEIAALTEGLKSPADGLRWSAPAGWHITLQFLGQANDEQYDCVAAALHAISPAEFDVCLKAPGFFVRAGVFFVGVELSVALVALQQQVIAATSKCGFVPEDRPYHPHITLARTRQGSAALCKLKARLDATQPFSGFTARKFVLYESFPGPGGSRYEEREQFPFGK